MQCRVAMRAVGDSAVFFCAARKVPPKAVAPSGSSRAPVGFLHPCLVAGLVLGCAAHCCAPHCAGHAGKASLGIASAQFEAKATTREWQSEPRTRASASEEPGWGGEQARALTSYACGRARVGRAREGSAARASREHNSSSERWTQFVQGGGEGRGMALRDLKGEKPVTSRNPIFCPGPEKSS